MTPDIDNSAEVRRSSGCLILVAVLAGLMAYGVWRAYQLVSWANAAEHELHAVVLTARLIEDYVERHEGAWPRCWDDLHRLGPRTWTMYAWPADMREVQQRVRVDFRADPGELATQSAEEFAAIQPAVGYYDYAHRFRPLLEALQASRRPP